MGDLQIGENFQDRCKLVTIATGVPAAGLADVTCTIYDELGNASVGTVAEIAGGWYKVTDFTPDAAGTWHTDWSKTANPELYYFYHACKEFKVGGGEVTDIKADTAAILEDTGTTLDNLVDDLETRLTAARAGYLDELDFDLDARIGAPAGASVSADIADIEGKVDGIEARTDHHEITKTFFSPIQGEVVLDTSHTDASLPTVTLPNITGTITHVYAGIKFRMIENTNAGVNKLSGAQEIQIQAAAEGWADCIHLVDDQFTLAASTREGGDCIIGYTDVVGTVDVFNDTYEFQWDEPLTDADAIHLNDVQTFLIVSYY